MQNVSIAAIYYKEQQMTDNSIEILGQKFSYPDNKYGALSVFFICASISFIAWTLEPNQINAYANNFGTMKEKQAEADLVSLNNELNKEVNYLRVEVLRLAANNKNVNEDEKKNIVKKIDANQKIIDSKYSNLIKTQNERQEQLDKIISISNQQQQQPLLIEKARLQQQTGLFVQQQQLQQQR